MENAGKEDTPEDAERKGLGTPATRAAIIEKLVAAGFVERKGKNLIPTKAGINLVTVLPEPLTSPMLTAEWEQKLTEIAKGDADPDTFMDGIRTMVREIVSTYSCISEDGKKLFAPEKEVIGTCPRCGQPVYEGKKNFACSDRSCGFVLWKNDRFWTSRRKDLTKKMATDLLKKGRTNVKGMWSEKKQATYDAAVILCDTGGRYIDFKLEFPKNKEAEGGAYMPDYSYNKDYPFAAFITNLGKYNEGELVGEWVKFPTTAEEMKEVFKRIGIGQRDDFGQPYEEWFITDYDCYVDGLYSKLGEYENLDELNYLASKLDEMSDSEYAQFQAGMEMGDHCGSLQEIINLTENLDCYEVYPNIHDYDDLGRYYIEELEVMQVPEHLQNYIDYEAYGRDVAMDENGSFTDQGYVRDTGDRFCEYYDGERGSIPDEYRVMTFQDDLPEEEKSEWAMDIAFDMDEFFRQNDPQYAAEHPEAHAAKEALYENLMAGRISALEEKLAALGQTQEDYLPSEIEKFKDATGYEEFLDFDPAEVKAALEDPNRSRVDEMLAAAEKAEQEYAAEAAAYAQTPTAIVEQARAAQGEPVGSFSIYQLKGGSETLDYRFEPLDSIHRNGLSVKPENYELVYEAPMTAKDNLESIYTRFNVDRPADFTGHSLSVSDIVVLHQDGKDTAHYCDRAGFSEVPEFLRERQPELTPDDLETGERVQTPRGSFYVTAMSREQMEAAGYGVHHISDDGKYLIMGNGTRAFAVAAEQLEKDNPLRTAEMTLEDDYGMIDGVINNGRRGEELEKAREHAERTQPEKKPSIRERLAAAKQECAKQQPRPAPEKKPPELGEL